MQEQNVSLGVAVLAKKAGFDWDVDFFYHEDAYESFDVNKLEHSYTALNWNGLLYDEEVFYSAPKQSHLQKWLREVKKILIEVKPIDDWNSWTYSIYEEDAMAPFFLSHSSEVEYETYEAALEAGLRKALDTESERGG